MRVATSCPQVHLGNVSANVGEAITAHSAAAEMGVDVLVFPELSLTGYSIGDLLSTNSLYEDLEVHLPRLLQAIDQDVMVVAGLPFRFAGSLYDSAAVIAHGRILGIVPKRHLPNYKEFYESRWFRRGFKHPRDINYLGQQFPFGSELLFKVDETLIGVEICEDLWVANPPSVRLARHGAHLILNPSASPEQVGKSDYRRQLITQQSGRVICGYVYAGCDSSESTQDIVMSGHQIIAANEVILKERLPLSDSSRLLVADIDIDHLNHDRLQRGDWRARSQMTVIEVPIKTRPKKPLDSPSQFPFIGSDADFTLDIQAHALASRIHQTKLTKLVLGLSGGLDSSLALLVADRAAEILQLPPQEVIHPITLPARASSQRTKSQAQRLADFFNLHLQSIPLEQIADSQAQALGVDLKSDVYGSIQARLRTALLMNRAGQLGGFMLGTSDLSEIAMGFSTFGGDHLSHYNVNAGVPKTLVRYLVLRTAEKLDCPVLREIAETPISPELLGQDLSQSTEQILGSYEINDFFLYYLIRWSDTPAKIIDLAQQTFPEADIPPLFHAFYSRFLSSQWKRSVMPDGPKVGSVSLSPRGDWRLPAEMHSPE
jgi:NAD+ synthase (glutamine-hydrolysing)